MPGKSRASRAKKARPNKVKDLRIGLGMYQNDLARVAKISVASVRGMESLSRDLSATLKARIFRALRKEWEAKDNKGVLSARDVFPNEVPEILRLIEEALGSGSS